MPFHSLSLARGRGRVDNGYDANDSPDRSLCIDLREVTERPSIGLERLIPRHAGAARSAASSPRGGPIRGRILSHLRHSSRRRGRVIRRRSRRRFTPLTRIRLHRRLARSRHIRSRRFTIAVASASSARLLTPRAHATTVASHAFDTPFTFLYSSSQPPVAFTAVTRHLSTRGSVVAAAAVPSRKKPPEGVLRQISTRRSSSLARSPVRTAVPHERAHR